jgi:hypothetical protein
MGLFGCDHQNELIETRELPSPCEQLEKANIASAKNMDPDTFFQKAIVSIVRCKVCGRIAHVVTRNPQ